MSNFDYNIHNVTDLKIVKSPRADSNHHLWIDLNVETPEGTAQFTLFARDPKVFKSLVERYSIPDDE